MKCIISLMFLACAITIANSATDSCDCHGFVLDGDSRNVVFTITYPNPSGCEELGKEACTEQCETKFGTATDGGDLDAKPSILQGLSVGDFICSKLRNVNKGTLSAFAQVCDDTVMDTGLKGKELICCFNGNRKSC